MRSLRYPGLISWKTAPGGGTTDYAVEIFHAALERGRYTSFLAADTALPMMYMPDAIRATLELMEAPADAVRERQSYNLAGISFTPADIARGHRAPGAGLRACDYAPDFRQAIADSWPRLDRRRCSAGVTGAGAAVTTWMPWCTDMLENLRPQRAA